MEADVALAVLPLSTFLIGGGDPKQRLAIAPARHVGVVVLQLESEKAQQLPVKLLRAREVADAQNQMIDADDGGHKTLPTALVSPLALTSPPAQNAGPCSGPSALASRRGNSREKNVMPRTLFDKIWDFHLVGQRSDGRDLIYIDRHVLHELHAHHAFTHMEKEHRAVHRPDLTFAVQDHTVATKPGRNDETNPSGTAFLKSMREGTRRNGIRLFDIDDPEQGISHVVAPEVGMVLPGATHAVPDSHASTVGGVGALAFGCGASEMTHILVTQVMALK